MAARGTFGAGRMEQKAKPKLFKKCTPFSMSFCSTVPGSIAFPKDMPALIHWSIRSIA